MTPSVNFLFGEPGFVFRFEGNNGLSNLSRTSNAVTQSDLTISKERKPRTSTISSFGLKSRYAPKFTKSRNRRAVVSHEQIYVGVYTFTIRKTGLSAI